MGGTLQCKQSRIYTNPSKKDKEEGFAGEGIEEILRFSNLIKGKTTFLIKPRSKYFSARRWFQ